MNHGKIEGYVRKCRVHGEHGPLYLCPEYDEATKAEINLSEIKYLENLRSKSWCEKQIRTGTPREGILMFRMFAGLDPDDWTD